MNRLELLDTLQLEYTTYKWRAENYEREGDVSYFEKVCQLKKEKIEDIAQKNSFPSIFNEPKILKSVESKIFVEEGMFPNFHYKDEENYCRFLNLDKKFFFKKGLKVKSPVGEAIVEYFDSKINKVKIRVDRLYHTFDINYILLIK